MELGVILTKKGFLFLKVPLLLLDFKGHQQRTVAILGVPQKGQTQVCLLELVWLALVLRETEKDHRKFVRVHLF